MRHETGFFHHIGSFLLFAAAILLVVTSISAPTVKHISLLRVEIDGGLTNRDNPAITFGTFGWCVLNNGATGQDECHGPVVGYSPGAVLRDLQADNADLSERATNTTRALTHVMILHPIAAGLAFIAFLLAVGAGFIGSLVSALLALATFLVALAALVCDFVGFAIVAREARKLEDSSLDVDIRTMYGSGAWTLLVATICLLLGTLVVFFTCCSARLHHRRRRRSPRGMAGSPPMAGPGVKTDYGAPARGRRRWGFF